MKIEIELIKEPSYVGGSELSGWQVAYGDKFAHNLGYEEMIGLVAAITMPEKEKRHCLQWLKTEKQHQEWSNYLRNL